MNIFNQYRGLRREIYVLFFGRIVTNLGSMVWPVMTMILNLKLGMSATEISYFFVFSGIIMLPAGIVGGKLADRFNKKKIIVACDSVSIICFFISAAIPLGIGTIIIFILAGVFQSVEYPSYDALFADLSATKDRERAFSLEYLGGNLGLVLSPTIAGLLFKDYLWLSFLISGVAIGISTILIAVLIKDVTPVEDTSEEAEYQKSRDGASIGKILKENPLIILYIFCMAFYYAAYGSHDYIMPLDMAAIHGETGAVIFGTITSLNCITVVIFTPIITKLFAKIRDTGKIIIGKSLVFIGYVIFLLLIGFIPGYYAAIFIFTLGEIFSTVSEGPYITTRVPASHRGRINGLMTMVCGFVSGVVEVTSGQLYDNAGSTPTWILVLSVTLVAITLAVILKKFDKKAYPKLYQKERKEAQAEETP